MKITAKAEDIITEMHVAGEEDENAVAIALGKILHDNKELMVQVVAMLLLYRNDCDTDKALAEAIRIFVGKDNLDAFGIDEDGKLKSV